MVKHSVLPTVFGKLDAGASFGAGAIHWWSTSKRYLFDAFGV
jgi:hypothetical protein